MRKDGILEVDKQPTDDSPGGMIRTLGNTLGVRKNRKYGFQSLGRSNISFIGAIKKSKYRLTLNLSSLAF